MAKKRKAQPPKLPGTPSATLPGNPPFEVELTRTAEAGYVDLYQRAKAAEEKGDTTNAICTTFRMVQEAIKVSIPRDPLNKNYALSGELSNIFRIKKGRLRICWIASSKMRRVCVLFISESLRKAGDASDPYRVLSKMVSSGHFDEFFEKLGVRKS